MEQRPLHWSERAKMYPPSSGVGTGGRPQPAGPRPPRKAGKKTPKATPSRKGFLLALLTVLVLAVVAAVLLLWYLPSRGADADESELAARSLVRQATTALEKAYAEALSFDPATIPPSTLMAIAPSITFNPVADTSAAIDPTAQAEENAVDYAGTRTTYSVGTVSKSGTKYGVVVDNETDSKTYYLNGSQVSEWEQVAGTATTAAPASAPTSESPVTTEPASQLPTGAIAAASDVEAMTLLRDSMTSIESAFTSVGTFEPSAFTGELLRQMDPSVTFIIRDTKDAATAPEGPTAEKTVDFFGAPTTYAVGTVSASGTTFGVVVNKDPGGKATTYYVNGQVEDWSTQLLTPVIGALLPHWA